MKKNHQLTAIIEREENMYVAFCPEIDVASQCDTVEEARNNIKEAIELFFECASEEIFITRLRWLLAKLRVLSGQKVARFCR